MPFKITYEPLNRIRGVKPETTDVETAAKAWAQVQALMASDEKVTIIDPHGRMIGWQALKALAVKETH